METTAEIAPKDRSEWPRWAWEKIATVMAVIGLADLLSQQIRWAAAIHWVIGEYRLAEVWLFGWLPLDLPPASHDYIVLCAVLFGVTGVGYYEQIRRSYVLAFFRVIVGLIASLLLILPAMLSGRMNRLRQRVTRSVENFADPLFLFSLLTGFCCVAALLLSMFAYAGGALVALLLKIWLLPVLLMMIVTHVMACTLIAWRWVFSTTELFVVLIAVNEVYVRSLLPMAGH